MDLRELEKQVTQKIVVLFSGESNISHIFKNQTIIHCEFIIFNSKMSFYTEASPLKGSNYLLPT